MANGKCRGCELLEQEVEELKAILRWLIDVYEGYKKILQLKGKIPLYPDEG